MLLEIYPFLNKEYGLRFIYFLFETSKVIKSTKKNKPEIISGNSKVKNQSISKKFTMNRYEKIIEKINEDKIIGTNSIKDSKIINFIIPDFSKPRILKTKF